MADSKAKNKKSSSSSSDETTTTASTTSTADEGSSSNKVVSVVYVVISALYIAGCLQVLVKACQAAYEIRLYAINEYGRVIHEFDPYFNYRATEYLWANGYKKFFAWFDYQSWYPLGRPVGTTIYPGMQFSAVWIKQFILPDWSINDVCCLLPAWFGVSATLATAGLAYVAVQSTATANKCSLLEDIPILSHIVHYIVRPVINAFTSLLTKFTGSSWGIPYLYNKRNPPALECAVFSALIMSVVPAHLLRSVGGGFDNESVATTAMILTFLCWIMTLWVAERYVIPMGIISGFAYFYMVAAWGGYVFVINLIGLHAIFLLLLQKYTSFDRMYKGYTTFYIVGTFLAMQVPVVGWQPLKSLEQLGPFGVFMIYQVLQLMKVVETKYCPKMNKWKVRFYVLIFVGLCCLPIALYLWSAGYVGPISARVRGLFVKHTKTGNPLVDSVAEHQAASPEAYFQYLNAVYYITPIGFGIVTLIGCTPTSSFLVLYGITAYYFSNKMVRLILLTAPIASVLGGIALGYGWAWMVGAIFNDNATTKSSSNDPFLQRPSLHQVLNLLSNNVDDEQPKAAATVVEAESESSPTIKKNKKKGGRKGGGTKKKDETTTAVENETTTTSDASAETTTSSSSRRDPILISIIRLVVSYMAIKEMIPHGETFHQKAHEMAKGISHPTIIMKGQDRKTGNVVVLDDYREAYWWLRDNTPEDSRVMAWWDYGYQITGIANRTTIADGNTWNHEHIALLGRILTSPEKEGHRIARHLADYMLVWAGGGGDDLAKSPHLIRIANSVYRGLCKEPTCRTFGMTQQGQPSRQMSESLLFKLHSHKLVPGVEADPNRFREVYRTKYGKVRIFKILSVSKESKKWVKENRVCDAPGSWYCPGQYPPALKKILKDKKDFKQLEDFNVKGEDDSEYQRKYFENLHKPGKPSDREMMMEDNTPKQRPRKLSATDIDMINEKWENNEFTSVMYDIVSSNKLSELKAMLQQYPEAGHIRSEDGRGPMWWAHENGRAAMVKMLKKNGVSETRTDDNGITPLQISKIPSS